MPQFSVPFTVSRYRVSRFPISASAGIRSLGDLVRHGTGKPLQPGDVHVFFNATYRLAMILAVDDTGTTQIPTRVYLDRKTTFDVQKALSRRGRPGTFVTLTKKQFDTLLGSRKSR